MTILRIILLAMRLHGAYPQLDMADAMTHAEFAIAMATDQLSPEVVLGVAFVESRFDPRATSRPRRARAWGFCGVMQTIAESRSDCIRQRDLGVGYALGVQEISWWLANARVRGNLRRALLGHGCGLPGLRLGWCGDHYADRVLGFARKLGARLQARRP